jgi:hypothetical protein
VGYRQEKVKGMNKHKAAKPKVEITTLEQLEIGDFFFYKNKLFIKTQAWWDKNPGMDYGVIKFTKSRGKVKKEDLWLDSETEVTPAAFMNDFLERKLV